MTAEITVAVVRQKKFADRSRRFEKSVYRHLFAESETVTDFETFLQKNSVRLVFDVRQVVFGFRRVVKLAVREAKLLVR